MEKQRHKWKDNWQQQTFTSCEMVVDYDSLGIKLRTTPNTHNNEITKKHTQCMSFLQNSPLSELVSISLLIVSYSHYIARGRV